MPKIRKVEAMRLHGNYLGKYISGDYDAGYADVNEYGVWYLVGKNFETEIRFYEHVYEIVE